MRVSSLWAGEKIRFREVLRVKHAKQLWYLKQHQSFLVTFVVQSVMLCLFVCIFGQGFSVKVSLFVQNITIRISIVQHALNIRFNHIDEQDLGACYAFIETAEKPQHRLGRTDHDPPAIPWLVIIPFCRRFLFKYFVIVLYDDYFCIVLHFRMLRIVFCYTLLCFVLLCSALLSSLL